MPISKRMRFEVFKRDGFKCQYCGRTPPSVILEVDHIIAKVNGGKDDINNYICSCFDCNRGKGKNSLNVTSETLKSHFKQVSERQEQLKHYSKFLRDIENAERLSIQHINQLLGSYYPNRMFSNRFNNSSLKTFLKHLPEQKIKDALSLAANHFPSVSPENAECAVKYFCGICWNWIKHPETRGW